MLTVKVAGVFRGRGFSLPTLPICLVIKNAQVGVVRPSGGELRCGAAAIGVHSGNHPSQRGRTSIMTAIRGERESERRGRKKEGRKRE